MTAIPPGKLRPWVMLPTQWIQDKRLRELRWLAGKGADNAAALISLIALAHHADRETGEGQLTYGELGDITSLSRPKVSAGLKILVEQQLVTRKATGRSSFVLTDYDPRKGWGKLPAQDLYSHGRVAFFAELNLRKPAELDALKLYLLFVARRDNTSNFAHISYDKIENYTGIDRNRIKSGLSLLAANGMIHVEHPPAMNSEFGISSAYRLPQLDPHIHMGTRGRNMGSDELRELLG